jgi:hypothetical protein
MPAIWHDAQHQTTRKSSNYWHERTNQDGLLSAMAGRKRLMGLSNQVPDPPQTPAELQEENRKLRRLQIMMNMVMSVISQDPQMTIEEASELAANTKKAALAMFPDKELAYDLIYKPRLQRLLNERFRLH